MNTDTHALSHEQLSNFDSVARRVRVFLGNRIPEAELEIEGDRMGVVVLHGRLPDPATKRRCLEGCRHVAGVIGVIDDLTIRDDAGPDREALSD